MKTTPTSIHGVTIITPSVYGDHRGFFFESYNRREYEAAGINDRFVQDNHSRSGRGVIRGLHYQKQKPQGKLVRCIEGEILDVIVDIRIGSPTFGRVLCIPISAENRTQVWIPPGLAHGFSVLSKNAEFLYKVTDYYDQSDERGILWSDPTLGINWRVENPILSNKDRMLPLFEVAKTDFPHFN